jgi:mycothiol synthase
MQWNFRPYREGDIPAIVRLTEAIQAHGEEDSARSESEIRARFEEPGADPARQVLVLEGPFEGVPEGVPVGAGAFGVMGDPGQGIDYIMQVWAHPAARARGLEDALYRRLFDLAREHYTRLPDKPERTPLVYAQGREKRSELIDLFKSLGMELERVFWTMERDLSQPIEDARKVEGVTLRTYRRPEDNAGATAAYNDSFQDHWDHHDETVEMWTHHIAAQSRRPDLSWVGEVDAEPGKFGGFCLVVIHPEDNERSGVKEGWIELLGTTREWRGKGLGKALLLHGLRSLRDDGMDTALLGVDSDSPTGANRLYESVGFTVRRRSFIYRIPVDSEMA